MNTDWIGVVLSLLPLFVRGASPWDRVGSIAGVLIENRSSVTIRVSAEASAVDSTIRLLGEVPAGEWHAYKLPYADCSVTIRYGDSVAVLYVNKPEAFVLTY